MKKIFLLVLVSLLISCSATTNHTHVVTRNETLSSIALDYYGGEGILTLREECILERNGLRSREKVEVGMTLVLPTESEMEHWIRQNSWRSTQTIDNSGNMFQGPFSRETTKSQSHEE